MDKSYRCLCSNNHGVVLQPIRAANKKLLDVRLWLESLDQQ